MVSSSLNFLFIFFTSFLQCFVAKQSDILLLGPSFVTQLSSNPRIFLYKGFLTDKESDHLISLANGKLERSTVIGDKNSVISDARTSSSVFLAKKQDDIITKIEHNISAWTFLPIENGEAIQVLRYEKGEKYDPHYDAFRNEDNIRAWGNRIATVLMYLSNVGKGGETIFPLSEAKLSQKKDDESWSECAMAGYSVKAVKGDALLFFNLHPNQSIDLKSFHGSCPVIHGQKWTATKWINTISFDKLLKERKL